MAVYIMSWASSRDAGSAVMMARELKEQSPLEKLIGSQLVNKFPAYYEARKFITAFTTAMFNVMYDRGMNCIENT